jgi:beta-N-acetylhexosaminidase
MSEWLRRLGELFIIGFPSETPALPFLQFLSEEKIGGVILFADNCVTHQLARENIETVRSRLRGTRPFIAVDQEGGRVCRLKGAPAEYEAAWFYGQKDYLEHFREDYTRSAVFMESIGINLNLAPVCDVFLNRDNRCLVDRCFGRTPEQVVPYVRAAVEISRHCNLLCCLKHFPGLGAAGADPHQTLPVIECDQFIWEQRERIPFSAGVEAGADMIMTTHVRFPRIDRQIVTGSERIISSMLRQVLAFDGPVITDDLTMRGAEELGNIGERTVAAFRAGHDLLLFGQDFEAAMRAFDYFREACERGEIPVEQIAASLSRVSGTKFRLRDSIAL